MIMKPTAKFLHIGPLCALPPRVASQWVPAPWVVALVMSLLGLVVYSNHTPAFAQRADGVIVMYHRFGDTRFPSTNVTVEQLEAHIEELIASDHTVVPLWDIVQALAGGPPVPEKAVAITVDDAFRSLYEVAWPRLKKAGFPFTVFVATDAIDRRVPDYMTWDELREMASAGVEIGSQTVTHPHLPDLGPDAVRTELQDSLLRIASEIGKKPRMIAYPYGEASAAVMALAKSVGFEAGFGQHSGVPYPDANRFYLPRYAINETYGGLDRFRRVINTLPLPARDISPADPYISGPAPNPPSFGFTLPKAFADLARLTCYHSQFGKLDDVTILGGGRVEIRFPEPFGTGRSRINCTFPAPGARWRWFGQQFYTAAPE